jgi:integrase
MTEINWRQDYHREFICPECNKGKMRLDGTSHNKREFCCTECKKYQHESCSINIKKVEDPLNSGLYWFTNHRIKDFICPSCTSTNICFTKISEGKKIFECRSCKSCQYDSILLTISNLSRYGCNTRPVKPFNWADDEWDLRSICIFDKTDIYYIANFKEFKADWFVDKIKKYTHHLSKTNTAFRTIYLHLSSLRLFSRYLDSESISSFDQIDRNVMLDYLSKQDKVTKQKLGALRNFFSIGIIKGWFNTDQDIIRSADYPKQYRGNPDPISDVVRKQIEENLHLLPDSIARMWLIGYFCAMRPNELALLKRDCLVREGQHWKLVWQRKKTKDSHEIPISRTIAQVVQEQEEHIKDIWGNDWDYLFCHYQNLSGTDPSMPKLKPVKKVLPGHNSNPLIVGIRSLISFLNIKNENSETAKFQIKLLRSTRLTELFEQGHDLAVVSAWAGHKQFATTSTYYTQVSCELMERETGHIQKALVNSSGHRVLYESYPKSFWENPTAHKLELNGTHINTPIYGMCGLSLDEDCHKFRACYTCNSFVATIEKLPQYINTRDELRAKQANALSLGQEVLVEQFATQADRLDCIIASLQLEAA